MQLVKLVLWILVWQIPVWIGASIVQNNMDWYHTLQHPFFSPPDWIFGVVWMVLYLMLAGASFYITRQGFNAANRKAVMLLVLQLILNAAWTPLFFGMHMIMLAMVWVLLLLVTTYWLIRAARPISRTAVWMMIPYMAWLCFAWLLNTSIWLMN